MYVCGYATKYNIEDVMLAVVAYIRKANIQPTQDMLYAACRNLPSSQSLVEALMSLNCQIDSQCLEVVCQHCSHVAVKYILDYKIEPQRVHFLKMLKGHPSQTRFQLMFETLRKYGYKPDDTDIRTAIQSGVWIPMQGRVGSDIFDLCRKHRVFPEYEFADYSKEQIELHKLCCTTYYSKISKHIKKHNLKADSICVENASKKKQNIRVMRTLRKHGGTVTIQAIKNNAQNLRSNRTLMYLIEGYEEDQENKDKKIQELTAQVEMLKKKLEEMTEMYVY